MTTIKKIFLTLLLSISAISVLADDKNHGLTMVVVGTSMGNFEVVLNPEKAPITVANFLEYVDAGFYTGTIFHRVIEYFMIQGGGVDEFLIDRDLRDPIKNESDNGLKNQRGTIAMARYNNPDSATSQFFINVEDNVNLDAKKSKPGYTVFGRVVSGMAVVDEISRVETENIERFFDLPVEAVIINSVHRKTK